MPKNVPENVARRRDRVIGLLIICGAFAACMALSLWAMDVSTPKAAPSPAPPTTEGLSGFPKAVVPFELLARARQLTGRTEFRGFVATHVDPDGTMDFTQKDTDLRFSFQSLPGRGDQPVRKGGTLPDRTYCGRQSVRVSAHGIAAERDVADVTCPRKKDEKGLSEPESCSLQDVWALAKTRKIKADGPARIEFYDAAGGPAYRFVKERKKGGPQRFVVSAKDCKKLLRGKSQRGNVP